MSIKIALAGNPNSGKTTLFNALTGSNQFVGNWPGVTVEKKEGRLKSNKDIQIIDLPGIYSLSPYTLEEVVARDYLLGERPDAILNIVDGTNIERNLYLSTQLLELGIPLVLAVNMMDIVEKKGDKLDIKQLAIRLGCPVVEISALKGKGVEEAAQKAVFLASSGRPFASSHKFCAEVEAALDEISGMLDSGIPDSGKRFHAIKMFERDEKITEKYEITPEIESVIQCVEDEMDDDSESIITNERYVYITGILSGVVNRKSRGGLSTSDKIDRIVTNRILAIPIFAVVMIIIYFVSITTVGGVLTDWANDGLFGDGWYFLGIGRGDYDEAVEGYDLEMAKVDAFLDAAEEAGLSTDAVSEALEAETPDQAVFGDFFRAAADVTAELEIFDDDGAVEEVLTITVVDYSVARTADEPNPADFGPWVPGIPVAVESLLESAGAADWLSALILDGIIGGVGAVLGFVPQMLVLFIFLAFLESCGYMARIAFIMDRVFRKFGLSGKSFIPMLIGTGCGIPGIMASRTIENERDRRMTVMTTTFIPCSAKLPIIALFAGAIFGGAWWVAPSAYFLGIAAIVVSGIILKKTKMFSGNPAPFVMELPAYHMPQISGVLRSMWERGWSFIKRAGTVILLSTIVIWFTSRFGFTNGKFGMVDDLSDGILATIGRGIAWIFNPLGWGDWKAAVATITGLIAKENVVGTFGVLYNMGEVAENGREIWSLIQADFTTVSAYSFLVFNLLCAPCFAAIGAIRREMNSAKWTWFAIGYQTIFAYCVALCVNQIGGLIAYGTFGIGTVFAFAVVVAIVWLLVRKNKSSGSSDLRGVRT